MRTPNEETFWYPSPGAYQEMGATLSRRETDLGCGKEPLEDFASRRARQVRENFKVFWHFISRKFFSAERPKFLVFHGHSFMKEQESLGNLPTRFILHSDNGHLFHLRVCREHFFDFPRVNIFA